MDEATWVREQYATEAHLDVRRQVWLPTVDGYDPASEALGAVRAAEPQRVLEVGCGTGEFAARVSAALPGAEVVAVDTSQRMVDLTERRGVDARLADVQALPFPDASFDAVAALWMLYHVPDLELGVAELRRVLRPGGTLVAVTNGARHVGRLRQDAGRPLAALSFSSENGEELLGRHFASVERRDFTTRAVFADHASALAYLQSSAKDAVPDLPYFEGSREEEGHVTLFLAR